jgi:hypothetical protein
MATKYQSSEGFTSDFDTVQEHLAALTKLLNKPEMAEWMKATDDHFNSNFGFKVNFDSMKDLVLTAEHDATEIFQQLNDVG